MQINKILSDTLTYGITNVVTRLLNYILLPFQTRIFLPNELGLITEIYTYIAFLNLIYSLSLDSYLLRFSNKKNVDENFKQLLFIIILFLIIFNLFLGSNSNQISILIGHPENKKLLIYSLIIINCDAIISLYLSKLRVLQKSKLFSLIQIVRISLNVVLFVIFLILPTILYKKNIGDRIELYFIINIMSSGIIVLALLIKKQLIISLRVSFIYIMNIIKYCFPLLFINLGGLFNELISRPAIKYLLPKNFYPNYTNEEVLGIFSSCIKIAIFINILVQGYKYAIEPFIFKSYNDSNFLNKYKNLFTFFINILLVFILILSANLDIISKIMIGEKFRSAIEVVPIMMFGSLMSAILYKLSFWYKIQNKTYYGVYLLVIGFCLTLVLNILLVPQFGYFGAAYAYLSVQIVVSLVSIILSKNYFEFSFNDSKNIFYILITFILVHYIRKYHPFTTKFQLLYGMSISILILLILGFILAKRNRVHNIFNLKRVNDRLFGR